MQTMKVKKGRLERMHLTKLMKYFADSRQMFTETSTTHFNMYVLSTESGYVHSANINLRSSVEVDSVVGFLKLSRQVNISIYVHKIL